MNLDELQTAQSRERQTDSLQQLRESFYEEAGRFIRQLREERSRAAERADDPFDAPEVRRLTDDIKTAERTVEAIYERRIGKLVKQASLEAAGMAADASGLTREEAAVFDRLVGAIEENRARVLDDVLGDDPSASAEGDAPSEPTAPESPASESEPAAPGPDDGSPERTPGVSAADLMGDGSPTDSASDDATTPDPSPPATESHEERSGTGVPPDTPPERAEAAAPLRESSAETTAPSVSTDGAERTDGEETPPEESSSDARAVERTTLRITADVGEILGVDERAYDLRTDDVVTLPTPNAQPLLQRDAAERLD
ncbi:hypothetical protein [Halomarina ordinaria]|uniref:DNA replication complex GINS family protein n=1 Tax=Halomarina ordinaria TaxID=3033939 RepID=A0ABD5U4D8_9EURY|nr:hypothetical protein [Halomarina sp. PSRA2]